jgi:hypothetical protein
MSLQKVIFCRNPSNGNFAFTGNNVTHGKAV